MFKPLAYLLAQLTNRVLEVKLKSCQVGYWGTGVFGYELKVHSSNGLVEELCIVEWG